MSRYGLNYYGLAYYGPDNPVSFVASNFTAKAYGYGSIQLAWNTPTGSWSKIRLVRNPYGFPVNAFDGDLLVGTSKELDPTVFLDDSGLLQGAFYYYSLFVFDTVSYSWKRAGSALGLSVKDYDYRNKLYNWLPEVTKIERLYNADDKLNNQDLYNFLSLFGFQLDQTHTLTALIEDRNNIERVNGLLLPLFLKQFGLTYEPEIGFQQARILIRDAIEIGKKKGSQDGLREFIKAFTGYGVPQPIAGTPNPSIDGLRMGKNLMLDYNDSSFEESKGHWGTSTASVSVVSLLQKKATRIVVATSVATLTVGTHSFKVNQKVFINGSKFPAFNTGAVTPVTITAVAATTISFSSSITTFPSTSLFNKETEQYPVVTVYPAPHIEATAPTAYPNKQKGILSVNRTTGTGNVDVECGLANPITQGVPVTAGLSYAFSVYAGSMGTVRNVQSKIRWYTRLGVFISETSGTAVSTVLNTLTARPSAIGTAPTGAYYAVPKVTVVAATDTATEFHYLDGAQFEQSASVTAFQESRQLQITLRATRINELTNPHFAAPITPWAVTGGTTSTGSYAQEPDSEVFQIGYLTVSGNVVTIETTVSHDVESGSEMVISGLGAPYDGVVTVADSGLNLTNPLEASKTFTYSLTTADVARAAVTGTTYLSGNSLYISATSSTVSIKSTTSPSDLTSILYPSTSYSFSIYAQLDTANVEEVTPSIVWYNSSKVVISTSVGDQVNVVSSGTSWDRVSMIATAPSNAAYAHVELTWDVISGSILILDSALFENVGVILPYFDGDHGPSEATDLIWEGLPNESRSHLYKNRFSVQTRLTDELLDNYVNLGTTFAVYLAQPQT